MQLYTARLFFFAYRNNHEFIFRIVHEAQMIFSSLIFLFLYLPFVLIIYLLLVKKELRNLFLVLASLFFYAWGEGAYVLIMLVSIPAIMPSGYVSNDYVNSWSRLTISFAVLFNVSLLGFFKYANFWSTILMVYWGYFISGL